MGRIAWALVALPCGAVAAFAAAYIQARYFGHTIHWLTGALGMGAALAVMAAADKAGLMKERPAAPTLSLGPDAGPSAPESVDDKGSQSKKRDA